MKKILLIALMAMALCAEEQPEESKSGFAAMSPAGKAAFVVAAPLLVAGAVANIAAETIVTGPFKAIKWLGGKAGELMKGAEDTNNGNSAESFNETNTTK